MNVSTQQRMTDTGLFLIFLGEALTWVHWLGGALIVAGAVLLAYA